ncbi:restriction endonuclease subunit S [Polaromonas sp.]|uniref:restriction endonuclease subunit S n=1 Tax=Polaromonas sp. TaxID=1869339 RepID=UPI0013B97C5D|nr:restriction endonuclease subunit S [Polaromonas sp.]NDP64657.1 restriction endonuclease subunit S [Polaromonas sp.]
MLLSNFNLLATAHGGVARLRELILTLAVQGKLVPQDPGDEPASVLLKKIRAEKDRLMAEGKIRRDKPLTEITDKEKPFEVPVGWEWVKTGNYFSELCTGPFGAVIHKQDYVLDGVPLINPSHMIGGKILHDPEISVNTEMAQTLSAYKLSAGDVVLARRGEVGRYALVTASEDGWLCGTGSFFAKLFSACNRSYLGLIFRDPRFRAHLQGESVGSTMTNLNQRIFLEALIAIPPLAEQSRIVTRVEELMRVCDALEAKGKLEAAQHAQLVSTLLDTLTGSDTPEVLAQNWQGIAAHFDLLLDRPEAIDAFEQTILQLAVRGLLVPQNPKDEPASFLLQKIRAEKDRLLLEGKIKRDKPLAAIAEDEKPFALPQGWEWMRFGAVALISSGITLGRKTVIPSPVFLPYLRVANVQRWRLNMASIKEVVIDQTELDRFQLLNGDLLITEGGDWDKVGRTAIWRDELAICLHQNHVFKARGTSSDWNPVWAEMYLNSMIARTYFASSAKQTTNLASINMTQLKNCMFPLPPLAEQSCIVARVEELRCLCAGLRQRLSASQTTQAHLAEALVESVAG